jgi:DNA invertase Pin-like site-specific DNA recombinase
MTKTVLFYARYSTDRQNEVSIETQVELGKQFVTKQNWKLVETYSDLAVSGTSFTSRPGIQQLLAHVKREKIDVVLCVTVDRLSRDVEHSSKILKDLRFRDVELWTVHAGQATTDMELSLRAVLSHELVEQIRYRTREGMKTSVRKGKATTCLAYGYKLSGVRDANGDRIPGLREIDEEKGGTVRYIFEQYAAGVSPRDIANQLNRQGTEGPRGKAWRDTAIRGHVGRGTGILNNEAYIGRLVWNKRNYRKNPVTERRAARANSPEEWVTTEVPGMRIVSDELWARVKRRQSEVGELFSHMTSNKLSASHRPSYLLSGLLECSECGGPYAIMAKDRYGCTNHKKRLPIDELDGVCCQNSKTIKRQDVEERVLGALPAAFFSMGIFDKVAAETLKRGEARLRAQPSEQQKHATELKRIEQEQKAIIQQISERAKEGRPRLSALDDMLDKMEADKTNLEALIKPSPDNGDDFDARLADLKQQVTPTNVELIINTVLYLLRGDADKETKQQFVTIIRMFVQKVVIGPTPGHQAATLSMHGRIASILASMEATTILEQRFKLEKRHEYLERLEAGELDMEYKQKKLLDAYAEELSVKRLAWANLQVSVVAGAGFEPAAFRL